MGLEIFKRIPTVQDYRLFAVPLLGETVDPDLFNGCILGSPPSIEASFQQQGGFGVRLQVTPSSAQAEPLDALVAWGDGTVSPLAWSGGSPVQIDHQYRKGGKYQVLIVAMNASGLRANRGLVVQTQTTGTNGAANPIPVISEVQLLDLRGRLGAANGLSSMYFQLETWPEANAAYLLGTSRSLGVSDSSSASFGHLIGWNMTGRTLSRVLLRPVWYDLQFAMGSRPAHFTLGGIRIGVYSTALHRLQYVDIPINAQNIRLYLEGSTLPSTLDNPTYDDQGRLKIPIVAAGQHFDRVELIFPQSALDLALQGPVLDPTWTGINAQLQEGRPGSVLDRSVFADGFEGGDSTAWSATLPTLQ